MIEKLKAAYFGATQGEWDNYTDGDNSYVGSGEAIVCEHAGAKGSDAAFIALAHNAMPDLIKATDFIGMVSRMTTQAREEEACLDFGEQGSDEEALSNLISMARILCANLKGAGIKTKSEFIAQCKKEITDDICSGLVPPDIQSFADLHDYRDANCYGGFCNDELADSLIAHYGGRDKHDGIPQGMNDLINEVQGEIDIWIKAGRRLQ